MRNPVSFSVVVPVYRAQDTLNSCVASILDKAPASLQLILVEDGSPDASGALCDAWAKIDPRVQALHQLNGGAASARNAGLRAATGDYLLFVDADDTLNGELFAQAAPVLQQHWPDCYCFGVQSTSQGVLPSPFPPRILYPSCTALQGQINELWVDPGLLVPPYGRCYRTQFLRAHAIEFDPALAINEDFLFNVQVFTHAQQVAATSTVFYTYCDTAEGTLSRQLRTDLLQAEATTRPAFAQMLAQWGCNEEQSAAALQARRTHCTACQYGLLISRAGSISIAQRARLFAQVFAYPPARAQLLEQARGDANRLWALPYRACLRLRAAWLLAVYVAIKQKYLQK